MSRGSWCKVRLKDSKTNKVVSSSDMKSEKGANCNVTGMKNAVKSDAVVHTRVVYNKCVNRKNVKGLLVRPPDQAIAVFHAARNVTRSYADVLKSTMAPVVDKPLQNETTVNSDKTIALVSVNCTDRKGKVEHADIPPEEGEFCVGHEGRKHNKLIYDVNGLKTDKFSHSILFTNSNLKMPEEGQECPTYLKYRQQSDFDFGFIPLTEPLCYKGKVVYSGRIECPIALHHEVAKTGLPNYMGARIPVASQLHIPSWKKQLQGYWDAQLLDLLQYGFPLGFNRSCMLKNDVTNHKSAVDHPEHVQAYIDEEMKHGAIIGPFQSHPIAHAHFSPFMTRDKPDSKNRRVIIDLSWPHGHSVNDGVDKNSYLGSEFKLTFPTIDHLTEQLVKLGKGAHIYKIDVKRAFRHLKIDPMDYDLLGLQWDVTYVDTCLPFGSRHGSQFFQRVSDALRYVMRRDGFSIINYIDDFLGYGTPSVAKASFDTLLRLLHQLGLDVSEKKLLKPSTQAVCLGILVDTLQGTVSIPAEKLNLIKQTVTQWKTKRHCTKRQLQSLLGTLLYIHKCVKPARSFLNRMLDVLRSAECNDRIKLTDDFHRDLLWFDTFLPFYNGVSLYGHKPTTDTLELDACLTGLGGCWSNVVYHLPIQKGHANLGIVHLEMVNILVALRIYGQLWRGKRILVKCDNHAVVQVLTSGKTRDPFLGACARNVWFEAALLDVELQYVHVMGKDNKVADLLSRWNNTQSDFASLKQFVASPIWAKVNHKYLELHNNL